MSLVVANKRVKDAHRELILKWREIASAWDDDVARRIGEDVIEPLEKKVRLATAAMEQMNELLSRAKRDVS